MMKGSCAIANPHAETGVKVVTIPDMRWKRRDIKSTSMLAQTMGKQEAKLRGAYEGWMVEDGMVTVPTDRPGLGVTVDADRIDDLTVRKEVLKS